MTKIKPTYFPRPVYRSLIAAGIESVEQLLATSQSTLLKLPGFGRAAMAGLQRLRADYAHLCAQNQQKQTPQ